MGWLVQILNAINPVGLVKSATGIFGQYFSAKTAKEKTIADWELEAIRASKGSWKDEYLTLILSSPIALQIIGSVVYQFTDDTKLLDSANQIYDAFHRVGLDYTQIMLLIIGASFGVHMNRTIQKNRHHRAVKEIIKSKNNNNNDNENDDDMVDRK